MGQHKRMDPSQGNTMEQFTAPVPLPQHPARSDSSGDGVRVPANSDEPSHRELLAAIQGPMVAWRRPEEVWRWLEMWDKAVLARTEGAGGRASRAPGAESPDRRSWMAGSLADTGSRGSSVDSLPRVEIQQVEQWRWCLLIWPEASMWIRGERLGGGPLRGPDYDLLDSGCRSAPSQQGGGQNWKLHSGESRGLVGSAGHWGGLFYCFMNQDWDGTRVLDGLMPGCGGITSHMWYDL
ncbi:hypothetical protein NDU88_002137 [Pleurodeles waltl]|uniref:Uncharacterized protein n=1 Tax=Pleurodeles waltl TaxID=8319 RepID=A0AAV7TKC2_PLEWA|nr:hypothetical protein NDU88_002137 [Pleurodeles waltl]